MKINISDFNFTRNSKVIKEIENFVNSKKPIYSFIEYNIDFNKLNNFLNK